MERKTKKPQPDTDETGRACITLPFLRKLAQYNQQFDTPCHTRQLFLHFFGFHHIQNLQQYTNLRILRLENNLLSVIQGLETLKSLRCLYLQCNAISKIQGLHQLQELGILDLSHNMIRQIQNIQNLQKLETFNISYNWISTSQSIVNISENPSIFSLDISHNRIANRAYLVDTLSKLNKLAIFYFNQNPIRREIPFYRKTLIARVPSLTYLDDQPVNSSERVYAQVWFYQGKQAEIALRRQHAIERSEERKRYIEQLKAKNAQKELELYLKEIDQMEGYLAGKGEFQPDVGQTPRTDCQTNRTDERSNIPSFQQNQGVVMKPIEKLNPKYLGQLLEDNNFNFQEVCRILSRQYECTEDGLRDFYFESVI